MKPKAKHGGRRHGSGRPREIACVAATVTVQLEPRHVAAIERERARGARSKGAAIRALIERASDRQRSE